MTATRAVRSQRVFIDDRSRHRSPKPDFRFGEVVET